MNAHHYPRRSMAQYFEQQLGVPLHIELSDIVCKQQRNEQADRTARRRAVLGHCVGKVQSTNRFFGERMTFPNPSTSLSHGDGLSIAVSTPTKTIKGVGVDIESYKVMNPKAARLFLTAQERHQLKQNNGQIDNLDLLRSWTIKEAGFKANPLNHSMSWFLHICADNPSQLTGTGRIINKRRLERFRYTSYYLKHHIVTVSITL